MSWLRSRRPNADRGRSSRYRPEGRRAKPTSGQSEAGYTVRRIDGPTLSSTRRGLDTRQGTDIDSGIRLMAIARMYSINDGLQEAERTASLVGANRWPRPVRSRPF
jgi:hypothetical protein